MKGIIFLGCMITVLASIIFVSCAAMQKIAISEGNLTRRGVGIDKMVTFVIISLSDLIKSSLFKGGGGFERSGSLAMDPIPTNNINCQQWCEKGSHEIMLRERRNGDI